MDLLKKASARAQQTIGEVVGQATKTELDADTTACLERVEQIRSNVEKTLSSLKHYVQPDLAADIVKMMEGKKTTSTTAETVAHTTNILGDRLNEMGIKGAGASVVSMAVAYTAIGQEQQKLSTQAADECFHKIRCLLDVDVKNVKTAQAELHTRRLDLDTLKNKKSAPATDVERLTAAFNEQQTKVRELGSIVETKVETDLKAYLKAFVDVELAFHNACVNELTKVQL